MVLVLASAKDFNFKDHFDGGRQSTRINTDAWLDENETFWRETLQKLLSMSANKAKKRLQTSGQIDSVLRQKMNSVADESLATNSNDQLLPTSISIMRAKSAELTLSINETKSFRALVPSCIRNSQIKVGELNNRITTAKNDVVEVEDKGISPNESSTFEMRFKNLNGTLSLSRPVQKCSDKTLMIIIGNGLGNRIKSYKLLKILFSKQNYFLTMKNSKKFSFFAGNIGGLS